MTIIKRASNIIKEQGLLHMLEIARIMLSDRIRGRIVYPFCRDVYARRLRQICIRDRVVLWNQYFGWSVTLFQRPQHIAKNLASRNCTVFYYTDRIYDPDVTSMKEILPNLFLVNQKNYFFICELLRYLDTIPQQKYIQVYSTNMDMTLEELKKYEEKGYQILYEYIDDLAPEISGTKELPKNIQEKFDYVTRDDHIPMVVTADLLRDQILSLRGEKNLAFATNGVDIDHFRDIQKIAPFQEKYQAVLAKKHPIVGYYGALAKWFDYDLLKYAASQLPDVEFVLIGKLYDDSFVLSGLEQVSNVHFIGPVPYQQIPQYATHFSICTIPFQVNNITNATSPLKLFEYMALGKPILTTAMLESSKYRSVNIAADPADFVNKIRLLLEYTPERNPEYYALLKQEAEENGWGKKADSILAMLSVYEEEKI